jgi:cytochrome c oxidase subunit 2
VNDWLRTILFLPPQASTISSSIDHLHFFVIITTMTGAAFVGVMAIWFVIRYRRSLDQVTTQAKRVPPAPGWVEGMIAGGLFTLFIAWWVVGFMQYIRLRVAPEHPYDIYVTAKQWMWKFGYVEGNHTISELYVPTGRPVRLIMSSRDVIHSFYVPDFRVKQDVLPGRYTTMWFEVKHPGRHDILCTEYCGTNHSMMRAQVIALDPADFGRWMASAPADQESPPPFRQHPSIAVELGPSQPMSLPRVGEQVAAQQGCLRCHTLDGTPHIAPTWAGLYMSMVPLKTGGTVIADEAYLTESMMDPYARIHAGYEPVMPSYLGRLRPAEVSALLELIKSLKSLPGETPHSPIAPKPAPTAPAGAIGPAPGQSPEPLLQVVPRDVSAPPPAEQGLPPPGSVIIPPLAGDVLVGPKGPVKVPEAGQASGPKGQTP